MKRINRTLLVWFVMFLCGCSSIKPIPETAGTADETENMETTGESIRFVTNINDVTVMESESETENIVKKLGIGINLGNTMEAFWEDKSNMTSGAQVIGENKPRNYETCWGAPFTIPEMIKGMKDAGFQTVRIPVYWGNMMENDGNYHINTEYLHRVGEIVGYCREYGLQAVINIHHYDEFLVKNRSKEEVLEIAGKMWIQIAEYFKDYGDFLIFEGYNENLGTVRSEDSYSQDQIYEYVNAMNQVFVDAVRSTKGNNSNRFLIISGYWTNVDKTTADAFVMPKDTADNRLMVSVHYIDNAFYWMNQIGNQEWLEYSKSQCELLKKKFTDQNIPVFVGECNGIYEPDRMAWNAVYKDEVECLALLLSMVVDYDFVPVIWDDGNRFYSRETCKITNESKQELVQNIKQKIVSRQESK